MTKTCGQCCQGPPGQWEETGRETSSFQGRRGPCSPALTQGTPRNSPDWVGSSWGHPRSLLSSPDPGHPQEQLGLGGLFPGSPRSPLPSPGPGHPGNSLDWVGWGQGFWMLEAGGRLEATSPLRTHQCEGKGKKGEGTEEEGRGRRATGGQQFCLFF